MYIDNIVILGKIFTFGPLNCNRYTVNIVILKIVMSEFCPIHFTATFVGT